MTYFCFAIKRSKDNEIKILLEFLLKTLSHKTGKIKPVFLLMHIYLSHYSAYRPLSVDVTWMELSVTLGDKSLRYRPGINFGCSRLAAADTNTLAC